MSAPDPAPAAAPAAALDEGATPTGGAKTASSPRWFRSPHLWVSTTYFGEGFPYTVVTSMAEILFKELGASLQVIGLTSLLHLPWNFKFLWGPFLDSHESKRRWLLACELAIVAVLATIALSLTWAGNNLMPLAAGFLVLALLSATHDIAIDGYYLEALDDAEQSRFVGYRAAAYRLAMLAVGGPLLAICARLGWTTGLLLTAAVMAALALAHAFILPKVEARGRPWFALARGLLGWRALTCLVLAASLVALEALWDVGSKLRLALEPLATSLPWLAQLGVGAWAGIILLVALLALLTWLPRLRRRLDAARERGELSDYAHSFVSFLDQPKIGVTIAFVLLFRTGESFLQKMRWPFFSDIVHLPLEVYGIASGTIGVLASFAATIIGGRLIARDGLRRWIWPFVLAQNVLNLLYMGVAMLPDPTVLAGAGAVASDPSSWLAWAPLTVIIACEHAGAGLGTAVFMVYLMRTCAPGHRAGHMAIVTALMSVGFTLAGVLSGYLAAAMGFATYFGFTFLATLPSMALVFFIPHLDGREP
ncbi:hypothetical protein G6O69_12600 [Pseudenhygromyxa sp. WMMC2535]|uniref:hypothetical protein n=1 Tax=Pseudenhygromyxa sp. WMMC2535 TaxID=2712867 RepID=UPI001595B4CE|nr:hypothetical protein [Pseudenhygromyxa sp. WMMC2535]NVB38673.1 hypothetical protein [Pseudenhygromyxa sp. WMMC2535]